MVKEPNPERPVQNLATQAIEPAPAPDMERIFRDHATRVMSAAYRVTGSAQDAEDVLQTIFMRLVRREGGAHLGDNPAAYLHRAAVNAALDLVRARRSARATPLDDAVDGLAAPDSEGADRRLASGELRDEVRKALADLSPRAAETFTLRYFEGYDNHEIARMQGASRSTVAVILHRARQRVRESIRPYVEESGDAS
jgi:RNA polymerase sigma-70 factor (ECF subfamily)